MMKKISCIAIDDEPIALLIIRQFCERKGGLELTNFQRTAYRTARDWPVQTGSGFSGY